MQIQILPNWSLVSAKFPSERFCHNVFIFYFFLDSDCVVYMYVCVCVHVCVCHVYYAFYRSQEEENLIKR